ncbi:MAG: hypothetical protein A3F11_08335 [Gammaproteobacteria bacterium RIFCSPHIGHO2_12_FULL_37_14]|nr:MAG: hypothetical protein A3F11_08335 [Gammaproteobacteria bacterium RIFCSPHIGHO2_12_FULL_37_14]
MKTKIGFMRWLGRKGLGNYPPGQWPEEVLFWEMLSSGTIRQKPWKTLGQEMERWSQLPWWRRVWEYKQRREMESIGKVLWYGCLFRAGQKRLLGEKRDTVGRIEIEIVKEAVLLEAQKWQPVRGGKCVIECVDLAQKTIYGEPLENVKRHIDTYRQLPWWSRWWHWREGRRVRELETLQVFLERYDAAKQTKIEQLERVREVYQREDQIMMNRYETLILTGMQKTYEQLKASLRHETEEKEYELRGKAILLALGKAKKTIQEQHQRLTRKGSTLSWKEFLSEHSKEWRRLDPIRMKIRSFEEDLSESESLKKIQSELREASDDMRKLHEQQRIAYWQSCLEEKLWQAVSAHDNFCQAADDRCLRGGKESFDEEEKDYMKWVKGLPAQVTVVLKEAGIEPVEADQIRTQFQKWFERDKRFAAQIIDDMNQWLFSCGHYALKRYRERKDVSEFKRSERWIIEKLQALGKLKKPDWLLNLQQLFVEQRHEIRRNYSIVLYRGTESLEAEWHRIYNSYLAPEWRRNVIKQVGTNFYLPNRKRGIEINLQWLKEQYHRLALRYHSDHGSGEAGEYCFRELQTWFAIQKEMLIKAVVPSPINIIWAQRAMKDRNSDRQIELDYQACLEEALMEQAQKKRMDEWEQQKREKRAEQEKINAEIAKLKADQLETDNELKAFKADQLEADKKQQEIDKKLETLIADQLETDKKQQETDKKLQETDKKQQEIDKKLETLIADQLETDKKIETLIADLFRQVSELEAQQNALAEENKQDLAGKEEQEEVVGQQPTQEEKKQRKVNRNRFFNHQDQETTKVLIAAAHKMNAITEQEYRVAGERRQKPKTPKCVISHDKWHARKIHAMRH